MDGLGRGLARGGILAVNSNSQRHGGYEPHTVESLIMTGSIFSATAGVIIAWWRASLGGMVLLVIAVAHSTFALISSSHNRGFAMLISSAPFLLASLLFQAGWWRARRPKGWQNTP